jgi:hypothetical protein
MFTNVSEVLAASIIRVPIGVINKNLEALMCVKLKVEAYSKE